MMTIVRCRTYVVNRGYFFDQAFARDLDGRFIDCLSAQEVLSFNAAENYRRNAAESNSQLCDPFVLDVTHTGKAHFRDRLCLASAYLAKVMDPVPGVARQPNSSQQFVLLNLHFFVAGVKTVIGQPSRTLT